MDSVLRPRDIQARIRAGETPEDVAAAAQTSVERIMGFATPVLAERAYQAQLAQRASVRRRTAAGQVGNLGSAVTTHLDALDVDPDSVEWDAWRRDDGRWTVVASYVTGGEQHQAAFAYDAAGRFVIAEDDEARALVGERSSAAVAATSPTPSAPAPVGAALDDVLLPRESPVGEQLPLGDDAISLVTGRAPEPAADPVREPRPAPVPEPSREPVGELQAEVTLDLTDASAAVRTAGPPPVGDADWISTQASERPAPAPATEAVDDDGDGDGGARVDEKEAMTLFEVPAPRPEAESATEASGDEPEEAAQRPARPARSRGRASVPSWDEIMFGTPKSE